MRNTGAELTKINPLTLMAGFLAIVFTSVQATSPALLWQFSFPRPV